MAVAIRIENAVAARSVTLPSRERRAPEVRAADLTGIWTRTSSRAVNTPGIARNFCATAPRQLEQFVASVQMRALDRIAQHAQDLLRSTRAIGAKGLSTTVIALRADCDALDWPAAEARLTLLEAYFSAVVHRLSASRPRAFC